jgi:hypothetical protein
VLRKESVVQIFVGRFIKLSSGTSQTQKFMAANKEDAERMASHLAAMRGWQFLGMDEQAAETSKEPVAVGAKYAEAADVLTCGACGNKGSSQSYLLFEEAILKCPKCGTEIELKGIVKDSSVGVDKEGETMGGDREKVPAPEERQEEPKVSQATTEINEPKVDMGLEKP